MSALMSPMPGPVMTPTTALPLILALTSCVVGMGLLGRAKRSPTLRVTARETFRCECLEGISFRYPIIEGYEHIQTRPLGDGTGCEIRIASPGGPELITMYRVVVARQALPSAAMALMNPHRVSYARDRDELHFAIQAGKAETVVIRFYAIGGPERAEQSRRVRDRWFSELVESFQVEDAECLHKDSR